MTFISAEDLKPFCPKVKDEVLSAVATSTEGLFCGILPLKFAKRKRKFQMEQVWESNGWWRIETSLLNISSANLNWVEIENEVDGVLGNALYFKGKISFTPVLTLEFESGYTPENLPEDLKDAMIAYATEQALMIGQGFGSNVASYKMGPRTISFRENSPTKDQVMQIIKKYQL